MPTGQPPGKSWWAAPCKLRVTHFASKPCSGGSGGGGKFNESLTSPSAGGVINQNEHFGHFSEVPVESILTAYSTDHQTL